MRPNLTDWRVWFIAALVASIIGGLIFREWWTALPIVVVFVLDGFME